MKYYSKILFVFSILFLTIGKISAQEFRLSEQKGYFENRGVNVMAFDDIYPEGHQGGVSIIMHGKRIATNGDIRFEPTPGQWQPLPKQNKRVLSEADNTITAFMSYPDSSKHLTGFNPMIYPQWNVNYTVTVKGVGNKIIVTVDLETPVPKELVGKVGFNLEMFPGELFGKPWIMDNKSGIFPEHPNGPALTTEPNYLHTGDYLTETNKNTPGKVASAQNLIGKGFSPIVADDIIAVPYAEGNTFTLSPDNAVLKFSIKSQTKLKLYDGRFNHNNGWFVLRSDVPAGATKNAIVWEITPNVIEDWIYEPVVQISQVGYKFNQPKVAVIERDINDTDYPTAQLVQIATDGEKVVYQSKPTQWGSFLRYNYVQFDFSAIKEEGLYKVRYGESESDMFRIADDVYQRGVWQPVLEYYLPVQMCHMKVMDKYRVWHDYCHLDDAQMAPTNYNHIDGYTQGASTLTHYHSDDVVDGVNIGGWHDAGDFDLRIESQSDCVYGLVNSWEQFGVNYDLTAIDQHTNMVEIHQPDGKNDIQQQIEHGVLSIVAGYKALGRPYRGIITRDLRQYVLLGDAGAMTDGVLGNDDDRWIFTQENPSADITTAARLSAAVRALKGFNDTLANQALDMAQSLFDITEENQRTLSGKINAAVELYLTTKEAKYKQYLVNHKNDILRSVRSTAWQTCRIVKEIGDKKFLDDYKNALIEYKQNLDSQAAETPYGVPYRPAVWGAGWNIQSFGYQTYFLTKEFPEIFDPEYIYNALNFVLGCHPGSNTQSFAAGVGTNSATVGYGLNRADWYYIPGAVASGTALIRPDFPELLVFPYLWQQVENCIPDNPRYMFLVLAADALCK